MEGKGLNQILRLYFWLMPGLVVLAVAIGCTSGVSPTLVLTNTIMLPVTSTPASTDTPKPTDTHTSVPFGQIIADDVPVRSGPGKEYAIFGTLARGDLVEILASEGGWHKARSEKYDDDVWVYAKFVQIVTSPPLMPTPTLPLPPTSTATSTSIPSPTYTPTPILTLTPTLPPTSTPMATVILPQVYQSPALLEPHGNKVFGFDQQQTVNLVWFLSEPLADDHWYEVQLWREGEEPTGRYWTKENWWDMGQEYYPGDYYWRVVVVQGKENGVVGAVSPPSETRFFQWIPVAPTPTLPSTPTLPPVPMPTNTMPITGTIPLSPGG